ncbi:hypothetical protein EMIT093MI4_250011 [Pseudomonas sp. IT-93MI4]
MRCVFCPYLPESHCRSEPARDSGVSDNANVSDIPLSRAGSLLQGSVMNVEFSVEGDSVHNPSPQMD